MESLKLHEIIREKLSADPGGQKNFTTKLYKKERKENLKWH